MPTFSLYYLELPGHRNLWKEPAARLLDPARMFEPSNRATGEMDYPLASWARHLPAFAQRYMEDGQRKKADQSAMRLWRINETIFSAFPHYLAASGASAMGTMAGISLHTELELLVRLGLLRAKPWPRPPTTMPCNSAGTNWDRSLPAAAPTFWSWTATRR